MEDIYSWRNDAVLGEAGRVTRVPFLEGDYHLRIDRIGKGTAQREGCRVPDD